MSLPPLPLLLSLALLCHSLAAASPSVSPSASPVEFCPALTACPQRSPATGAWVSAADHFDCVGRQLFTARRDQAGSQQAAGMSVSSSPQCAGKVPSSSSFFIIIIIIIIIIIVVIFIVITIFVNTTILTSCQNAASDGRPRLRQSRLGQLDFGAAQHRVARSDARRAPECASRGCARA